MTPLRVAFFVTYFPKISEVFILHQALALLDRGHDVRIHALADPGDAPCHAGTDRFRPSRTVTGRMPSGGGRTLRTLRALPAVLARAPWRDALAALNVNRWGHEALTLHTLFRLDATPGRIECDVAHAQFGDVARQCAFLAADGGGSFATAPRTGFPRGGLTVAQHDGGGSQPERLPPAPGRQGQAPKKLPETDAIFANLAAPDGKPIAGAMGAEEGQTMRLSIDCNATVNIGDYSRGVQTRSNIQAADHYMGCQEKYVPFGILEEDRGQLHLTFGNSFKTSDFIVDSLQDWWQALPAEQQAEISHIPLKVDNGPVASSRAALGWCFECKLTLSRAVVNDHDDLVVLEEAAALNKEDKEREERN